jgi:hypothetical protein
MRPAVVFYILYFIFLAASFQASAQEGRNSTHATVLGIGVVNQLDTYLSPLNYSGPQLQFLHETLRYTDWAKGHITMQTLWQANVSYTKSRAARGRNYGGDVSYTIGWHYNWQKTFSTRSKLRFLVGPQLNANAGVLYNTRNSNNPAQALATTHLAASGAVIWDVQLGRQPLIARYQLDLPLIGGIPESYDVYRGILMHKTALECDCGSVRRAVRRVAKRLDGKDIPFPRFYKVQNQF